MHRGWPDRHNDRVFRWLPAVFASTSADGSGYTDYESSRLEPRSGSVLVAIRSRGGVLARLSNSGMDSVPSRSGQNLTSTANVHCPTLSYGRGVYGRRADIAEW